MPSELVFEIWRKEKMTDEKKITEAEKLLYSLSAIKDILKMLECDVEVTMTWKNGHTKTVDCYKEIEKCVVDFVKSTKPYKFEDLKVGMAYYHTKLKKVCLLVKIYSKDVIAVAVCKKGGYEITCVEFEENRFFPVQMANIR